MSENGEITKLDTALAKIQDFEISEVDYIGGKFPQLSQGHKTLSYGAIALANLASQGAWASMGLAMVPVANALIAGALAVYSLGKSLEEDQEYADRTQSMTREIWDRAEASRNDVSEDAETLVGPQTRLNAIEVSAEVVGGSRATVSALECLIRTPFKSRAFFGGERCGKTYLAACASAQLAAGGTAIYYANVLAAVASENADYTRHCVQSCIGDALDPDTDVGELAKDLKALIGAWWKDERDSILLFDEFVGTADKNLPEFKSVIDWIAKFMGGAASTGMKRRHAIWAISPNIRATTMRDCAKTLKDFNPVLCAIKPGVVLSWKGQAVFFDENIYTQVSDNYKGIPHPKDINLNSDRIVFVDGEWRASGAPNQVPIVEVKPIEKAQGHKRTNFSFPAKKVDAFQDALEKNDVIAEAAYVLDIPEKAIRRLIVYLSDNKRGRTITARSITQNDGNRAAGITEVAIAKTALEAIVELGLCKPTSNTGEFQVIN